MTQKIHANEAGILIAIGLQISCSQMVEKVIEVQETCGSNAIMQQVVIAQSIPARVPSVPKKKCSSSQVEKNFSEECAVQQPLPIKHT